MMHMAWMRAVCGRIKSDYRYSILVVYNNFPWPTAPSAAAHKSVEQAIEQVLAERDQYEDSSLADLYEPEFMLPPLARKIDCREARAEREK